MHDGVVRQLQIHAFPRIGGGADGLSDPVESVGQIDGAVGIGVDEPLQIVRDVPGSVDGHEVRGAQHGIVHM